MLGTLHPFTSDLDKIIGDCETGHFEEGALRLKAIAANCKSSDPEQGDEAKRLFGEVCRILDEELRKVLDYFSYTTWCLAIAKTKGANLSLSESKLDGVG